MYSKEHLESLSETELQDIYQQLKSDFEEKLAKNRRINNMLERKFSKKQSELAELKAQLDQILESHPELKELNVAKEGFDDMKIKHLIAQKNELESTYSALQITKIQVEKSLKDQQEHLDKMIEEQNNLEEEIMNLDDKTDILADDSEDQSELAELAILTQEFHRISNEFQELNDEIEMLQQKIHSRG